MMNSKKSSVRTARKYFFMLPIMVLSIGLLNAPLAKSQNRAKEKSTAKRENKNHDIPTQGSWIATIKDDDISMQFKSHNDDHWSKIKPFKLSEFKDLLRKKQGTLDLQQNCGQ